MITKDKTIHKISAKSFGIDFVGTHVHRIPDDSLQLVRAFLLSVPVRPMLEADLDLLFAVSDFLSATKIPYRSRSKSYKVWQTQD